MNKKKTGLIVAGVLAALLLAMIVLPMVFKGKIVAKVKQVANESLIAKLDFKEVDISLFRSFPQLDIRIKDLTISGINEFEGKTLLSVETLSTSVSLSSLWKSDGMNISEILVSNSQVNLIVSPGGKANWDITKPTAAGSSSESKSQMKIDLTKIELLKTGLTYRDDQSKMIAGFKDGNFLLSGYLKGSDSKLNFKGKADSLSFNYGGSQLVSGMHVGGEGELQANFDEMSFKFLGNKFMINKLPLELQGTFVMKDKSDLYDLSFASKGSSLEELISFLPQEQQDKLKSTEKSGTLSFAGTVKGNYTENSYPAIIADLKLTNGRIKYPSMPNEISKMTIDAKLAKPEGIMDSLKISVGKFEAYFAGHPIIGNISVTTPESNPVLAGDIVGEIDFSALKNTIPVDSMELGGMINGNIHFNGPVSAIEKNEYDLFRTSGNLSLNNFTYRSPSFPETLGIQSAGFVFNSKEVTISSMKGKLGMSDFTVDGSLSDYWAYLLKNGTIKGNIKVKSSQLDITQLMNGGTQPKDSVSHSDPYVIPARVDMTIQADVDRMNYSRMDIRGTTGKLIIKDQKLTLDQLSMNMLKGRMVLSGDYFAREKSPANFNFKIDMKDFDLPTAYQSVGMVRHLLPIAGNSKGTFLSGLTLTGTLGRDYAPNFADLNGSGMVSMKNIELVGNNMFAEIGNYFRKDLFTNVKVSDFASNISITNGALSISPFTTKIANQEVTVSGNQSLALDLNYKLRFNVNKSDLSPDVTGLIGFVPGTENIEKLPVTINLGGNIAKPDVKVDLTEAKDLVAREFNKKAKSTLEDAAKKLGLDKLFK
jgi:uncharacterized protein involved in outer membrane biogenesis